MVDKIYWNEFYKKGDVPTECSTFAASVLSKISKQYPLIEFGCGNGRDAFYFAQNGINVIACDISQTAIELLNRKSQNGNPNFMCVDFTALPTPFETTIGTVYSRFTLHAIRAEQASAALKWAYANLREGGLLLIEVRSVKDKMYGKGQPVSGEPDAYINTHYRRFVRRQQLEEELTSLGFQVEEVVESDGLAVYKDDNPVVIRIHATKPPLPQS
jgi:SAM-dependent methyltransferase